MQSSTSWQEGWTAPESYTITYNTITHTHTHTHTHYDTKIVGNLKNYRQIELVHWTQFLLISRQEGGRPLGNNDMFRKARERKCFTQNLLFHIYSNLADFCEWTLLIVITVTYNATGSVFCPIIVFICPLRISRQTVNMNIKVCL